MKNLKVENLSKIYQDGKKELKILDNLSFDFSDFNSTAILGRSGIGKSTLLHLLGGLDKPTSGSVIFDETDISKFDNQKISEFRGANIGFVFQFHHLLPEFSAVENVAMPLLISNVNKEEAYDKARQVLDSFGLNTRFEHRPSQLSGGEQQRVALARAIVSAPSVLLADEPTGNLDSENAQDVTNMLKILPKEADTRVIVVTHSEELAYSMEKVLFMTPGGHLEEVSK